MAEVYINGIPVPFPKESPNERPDHDPEPWRFIILHSTGGAFAGAVSWLLNRVSKVSAHFVVSREGEIRQLVSLKNIAYHAGKSRWDGRTNLNRYAIGVEMEHKDRKQDWPDMQIIAVAELCSVLRHTYGIPMHKILGHANICDPPGRKIDPYNFPWFLFRQEVE